MKDAKTIALEFLQSFWDADPERGLALCAPDAVWQFQRSLPFPREAPVRAAVRLLNETLINAFDPDKGYTVDLHSAIGEGDEAAIEYSARGVTRSGAVYHNDYLVRMTVREGKIVSIRPRFDTHLVHKVLYPLD